jgi:hypothetical protein
MKNLVESDRWVEESIPPDSDLGRTLQVLFGGGEKVRYFINHTLYPPCDLCLDNESHDTIITFENGLTLCICNDCLRGIHTAQFQFDPATLGMPLSQFVGWTNA